MATREAANLGSRKRARRHAEPTTCPLSSIPSTPSPTHVARVGPATLRVRAQHTAPLRRLVAHRFDLLLISFGQREAHLRRAAAR
jgi:hypothetical protein